MTNHVYDQVFIQLAEYLSICHKKKRVRYTTEDEKYWCNSFSKLAWLMYAKLEPEFTKSLNAMNRIKIATDPEYVRTVLDIWYG